MNKKNESWRKPALFFMLLDCVQFNCVAGDIRNH